MRKVRTASFNGVVYDVDICEPLDGLCDYPRSGSAPTIRTMTPLGSQLELESLIHESMHACNWAATEEVVTRSAHEITRLLWRLGYRRPVS